MAGLKEFLFEGSPPPSVTKETTQTSGLPKWYEDSVKDIIARGYTLASDPYRNYTDTTGNPRFAPMNATEDRANQMTLEAPGAWQGDFSRASGSYANAAGMRGLEAANPYLSQSASKNSYAAGSPLIQAGAQGSGLGSAAPYLSNASRTFPGAADEYMSPYISNVVDEISRRGNQNLMENILPNVNQEFIGGGMHGGSRHGDFTNRAVRDVSREIAGEQSKALQSGYGQAADIFASDMARQAGLGSTAGGLATSDYNRMVGAGQGLGSLMGSDATNLANLGNVAGGLQVRDAANAIDIGRAYQGLGSDTANMRYKDAASVSAVGEKQRNLEQQGYDYMYDDFQRQVAHPWDQLGKLDALVRGQSVPRTQTSTTTEPGTVFAPSLASQLMGLGSTAGYMGAY